MVDRWFKTTSGADRPVAILVPFYSHAKVFPECMCLLSCSSRPVTPAWLFRQRLQIQLLVLDRPTCYHPTDTNPSTPYATISLPPRALIHPLAEFETLNLKLAAQSLYLFEAQAPHSKSPHRTQMHALLTPLSPPSQPVTCMPTFQRMSHARTQSRPPFNPSLAAPGFSFRLLSHADHYSSCHLSFPSQISSPRHPMEPHRPQPRI